MARERGRERERESMDKKQSNRIVELVESAIRRQVNGETPKGFYGPGYARRLFLSTST